MIVLAHRLVKETKGQPVGSTGSWNSKIPETDRLPVVHVDIRAKHLSFGAVIFVAILSEILLDLRRFVYGRVEPRNTRRTIMAKCGAGECEVECGKGKGCGCIAESDNPSNCKCYCFGDETTGGLTLTPGTLIDVSISELPVFEAAKFLNALHAEHILMPIDRTSEQVSLNLKRRPFSDVLNQLGLTTSESVERGKWRIGFLIFLAGLAAGGLIFSRALKTCDE